MIASTTDQLLHRTQYHSRSGESHYHAFTELLLASISKQPYVFAEKFKHNHTKLV